MTQKRTLSGWAMLLALSLGACGGQDEAGNFTDPLTGKADNASVSSTWAGVMIQMENPILAIGEHLNFSLMYDPDQSSSTLPAAVYRGACFIVSILSNGSMDIADDLLGEMSDAFAPEDFQLVGQVCAEPFELQPHQSPIDFSLPLTTINMQKTGIYHLSFVLENDVDPLDKIMTHSVGAVKLLINAHSPLFKVQLATENYCQAINQHYQDLLQNKINCNQTKSQESWCSKFVSDLRCTNTPTKTTYTLDSGDLDELMSTWKTAGCSRFSQGCH